MCAAQLYAKCRQESVTIGENSEIQEASIKVKGQMYHRFVNCHMVILLLLIAQLHPRSDLAPPIWKPSRPKGKKRLEAGLAHNSLYCKQQNNWVGVG